MAIAVLTTSTVSGSTSGNLVITKPTGVAIGDLLIIAVGASKDSSGNYPSCSGFDRNAQTTAGASGINPNLSLVLLTRIADSSDVAASNYTISNPSIYLRNATMFRVAWNGNNVNPIFDYSTTSPDTLKRVTASALMIMLVGTNDSSSPGTDISAYTVTSGEANPTWTEVQDVTTNDPAGTYNDSRNACAYAVTTNSSDITAWGYTITGSPAVNGAILAIIPEPQNVTSDISHLSVTPTIESVTASQVNVAPDISHLAITPTLNGVETFNTSDGTIWTTTTKS